MPSAVAQPYYTDPGFAQGFSNLAQLFAPPSRLEQAQAELMRQQSGEAHANMTATNNEQHALSQLAAVAAGAFAGPDGAPIESMDPAALAQMLQVIAQSGQTSEFGNILNSLSSFNGNEGIRRSGFQAAGNNPGVEFAGTQARADDLIQTNSDNTIANTIAGINARGNQDRLTSQYNFDNGIGDIDTMEIANPDGTTSIVRTRDAIGRPSWDAHRERLELDNTLTQGEFDRLNAMRTSDRADRSLDNEIDQTDIQRATLGVRQGELGVRQGEFELSGNADRRSANEHEMDLAFELPGMIFSALGGSIDDDGNPVMTGGRRTADIDEAALDVLSNEALRLIDNGSSISDAVSSVAGLYLDRGTTIAGRAFGIFGGREIPDYQLNQSGNELLDAITGRATGAAVPQPRAAPAPQRAPAPQQTAAPAIGTIYVDQSTGQRYQYTGGPQNAGWELVQ